MRLKDKVAVVVGGGQTPGDTIGNGRATAILFAREGARVVVVDRDLARARDTEAAILAEGGAATALEADVTRAPYLCGRRRQQCFRQLHHAANQP